MRVLKICFSFLGLIVFLAGCAGMSNDGHPSLSPEKTTNVETTPKQKLAELEGKKAHLEGQIENLDRERMAIQMKRMQPIGTFHATKKRGANGLMNARSAAGELTIDGDRSIDRIEWQEESVVNQIKALNVELAGVESDIDRVKNESKKTCFPSDTKILLANGKTKDISKIKIADKVLAYDIAKGKMTTGKVKKIFISENNHVYVINSKICATAYERFLTENDGWKKIRDLKIGDKIFNGNCFEIIISINKRFIDQKVYNFNVASVHNFFASQIGDEFFMIHNCGGGGSK